MPYTIMLNSMFMCMKLYLYPKNTLKLVNFGGLQQKISKGIG